MDSLKKDLKKLYYNILLRSTLPSSKDIFSKFELFKSTIDLELINFYKQFQIINKHKIEKHFCILILSAQKYSARTNSKEQQSIIFIV